MSTFLGSNPALASETITLAWDPSPESDVVGYRLHYGSASEVYSEIVEAELQPQPTVTLTGLAPGTTYYAVVIAYNQAGLESLPSNEITFETAANTPPTVSLEGPEPESTNVEPATITLSATATDVDGTIERVEYYSGSQIIGEATVSPWEFTWNNVVEGDYTLTAKAIDNDGAATRSDPVEMTVAAAHSPTIPVPRVQIQRSESDGSVVLTIRTEAEESITIEFSEDLENWSILETLIADAEGAVEFIDEATGAFRRFYRIRYP